MRLRTLLPLALPLAGTTLVLSSAREVPESAASAAHSASTGLEGGEFAIDPVHSAVVFRVRHLDVAYFYGRFNRFSGTVTLDDDPAKCAVQVEFDADSVDTASEGRDRHLRSPDFLDAVQFPKITFRSQSVKVLDEKEKTYAVTGTLDLHGEKKEITVEMKMTGSKQTQRGYKAGFEGRATIDRQDFGISYGAGMIGDEVTLIFGFELSRK